MTTLNVERHDRVLLIELNRPEVLNAVDFPMRRELREAFDEAARDTELRAVVLAAAGKAFCSGADLKAAATNPDKSLRRTSRTLLHDFQPLIECVMRMDKPVIGAINGAASGIGASLALCCDLLVMAEDSYISAPFVNLGLIPDGGISWFLTRRIGYGRAFEVMAEGDRLPAQRCLDWGLANRVVATDSLRSEALNWAAKLAEKPPIALAMTKRVTRQALQTSLSDALTNEAELQSFCLNTEDAREAVTAYMQKRKGEFHGR